MTRLAVLLLLLCGCGAPAPAPVPVPAAGSEFSPLPPLPPDETNAVGDSPLAARLGQRLFFDEALSANGDTSCATCHVPDLAFADARAVGQALGTGTRNTPTVLNSAFNRWFFRDGRADSAWSQALKPLEDPLEMGSSRLAVARRVVLEPELRRAYDGVFDPRSVAAADRVAQISRDIPHGRPVEGEPDHPHARGWARLAAEDQEAVNRVFSDVGKAMAAYERLLVGGDSAFDAWRASVRAGAAQVVPGFGEAERRGLRLFEGRAGCTQCHFGPLLSDGEFHNLGVPPRGGGAPKDTARYGGARSVTADPFSALGEFSDDRHGERAQQLRTLRLAPEDWGAFQTPGLRNVARTAPYMHAGQFATLREVLQFYSTLEGAVSAGHHGESSLQPRHFTEQEIDDLLAFLESLDEKPLPADLLRADPER